MQENDPNNIIIGPLEEKDLEKWFDHVSQVFSWTPRSYFVRHWENDQDRDLKAIRIAKDNKTDEIASTVKVYVRKMWINGLEYSVGGIGEVSTKDHWRKKGLASLLLNDSIKFMQEKGIYVSSLHTGAAAPVYAALGWKSVPRYLISKNIKDIRSDGQESNQKYKIRKADLRSDQDIDILVPIYTKFASQFNGTFVRDKIYWTKWIADESPHPYVIISLDDNNIERNVGYISLKEKKRDSSTVLVIDFFVSEDIFAVDRGRNLFSISLSQVLNMMSLSVETKNVVYPAPLFQEKHTSVEDGTMYLILDGCQGLSQDTISEQIYGTSIESKHIFWDADSF